MRNSILIVDDEPDVIFALQRTLLHEPYEIHFAFNGEGALKILNRTSVKVVISDQCLPRMEGAELLSVIKLKYPDSIRIILSGKASVEDAIKAVNSGEVFRFFLKPWNDMEIITALRSAVRRYDIETENRRLLEAVKRIRPI